MGLVIAGAILIVVALGGGGFVANVNNTDREYDVGRIKQLKRELDLDPTKDEKSKLEDQLASTTKDLETVTMQLFAALGGTVVFVALGGVLLAMGLRRRA